MAPSITLENSPPQPTESTKNTVPSSAKPRFTPGYTTPEPVPENYEFEHLTPSFPDVSWPALEELPYTDKGLLGDPEYKDLLADAADCFDYNHNIGTEIHGVSLKTLTDAQKNDLARLIAFRGIVVFRDQFDFNEHDQLELGRYWGTLHKHPTTAIPKSGLEEVHVVYADEKSTDQRALYTPAHLWHSDVTYEIQPPSYTSLKLLTGPPRGGGGDTLWSSQYGTYDLLSTGMQTYLKGLTALHTSTEQVRDSKAFGRACRREAITTEHPLVRTHPVTGYNSLFYCPAFITGIKGIPKIESDAILRHLDNVIVSNVDIQARVQWQKGTVVFWDNRSMNHTATYGFAPHRRHAIRVTPHGERPTLDPNGKSRQEEINKALGRAPINKDGTGQSNFND